jgi:hypothetical protein
MSVVVVVRDELRDELQAEHFNNTPEPNRLRVGSESPARAVILIQINDTPLLDTRAYAIEVTEKKINEKSFSSNRRKPANCGPATYYGV